MMKNNNCLGQYGVDISKYGRISYEEEMKLTKKISKGDSKSREKLINSNLKLVIDLAWRYNNMGVELSELICEGNKALIKAVDKFNYKLGIKFGTYAYWWIREAMISSIKNKDVVPNSEYVISIEPNSDIDSDNETNFNQNKEFMKIFDDGEIEVETNNRTNELFEEVLIQIKNLTPRESKIIKHYFGIDGHGELNIQELSDKYKLSSVMISNIIETSIRKIRCNFFENN